MSKPSTIQKVITAMEAERAELLAQAATFEHAIEKLHGAVAKQAVKPKVARKPKLVPGDAA